jgi:hypothetical protein
MTNSCYRAEDGVAASSLFRLFALAALILCPLSAVAQDGSGVQGAWVEQSQKCGDVFTFRNGKPRFKEPVNIFAPGMIITGKRLVTPQATCSLKSAKADGSRTLVTLRCANSISQSDVKVLLAKLPDGRLARYYDENDRSGSRYTYCSAQ